MKNTIKVTYRNGLLRYKHNGRTIFYDEVEPNEVADKIKELNRKVQGEQESNLSDSPTSFNNLLSDTSFKFSTEEEDRFYYTATTHSFGSCLIFCILFLVVLCSLLYGISYLLEIFFNSIF